MMQSDFGDCMVDLLADDLSLGAKLAAIWKIYRGEVEAGIDAR